MAGVATEESGEGRSLEGVTSGHQQQRFQSGEALAEWRSLEQVENGSPSTSPSYLESDDGDASEASAHSELCIAGAPDLAARRSCATTAGAAPRLAEHPEVILMNRVESFCTIHDCCDTLHRFWKKEHDWGWKKFMELSKLLDGFIDADTLIIKAQVQVISLCGFWLGMDQSSRWRMSREKTESILKVVVKHFFIEKEVTSTLVMDSLYCGQKALEDQNKGKKSKGKHSEAEELPVPIVRIENDTFVLVDDVMLLLERAAMEPLPPKDEKGPQNRTKVRSFWCNPSCFAQSASITCYKLHELAASVATTHIGSCWLHDLLKAVTLKKQEELIREEEAAWLAEIEHKARRGVADKEKKSKKKQGKQKRNNRKGKDKGRDDKAISTVQDKIEEDSPTAEGKELDAELEIVVEKSEAVEDVSDVSDSVDCAREINPPDSEDRDLSPVNWDTDTSELHPPVEASGSGISGLSGVQNGRSSSVMDDSSSTCSSDSVPSVISVANKGKSRYQKNQKSPSRGRNHQSKLNLDSADWVSEEPSQPVPDATHSNDASSQSPNTVRSLPQAAVQSFQDRVDEETGSLQRNSSSKGAADVDISRERAARVTSPPSSPSKIIPLIGQLKLEPKINAASDPVIVNKPSSDSPKQTDSSVPFSNSVENTATSKPYPQKFMTSKPIEKPSGHFHVGKEKLPAQEVSVTTDKSSIPSNTVMSRPLSAPLVPGPRPAVSMVSMVQTAPVLARSVSASGRLGPEPTAYPSHSYVPQSYRNAIVGGPVTGSTSVYSQNHSATSVVNASHSYSQAPSLASAPLFSPHSSDRTDLNPIKPNLSFGMVNRHDFSQNGPLWIEQPQRNGSRNVVPSDRGSLVNNVQSFDLYNPIHSRAQDHLPSEFQAGTSGRQSHLLPDEFPHLDIINELLDDEHGIGMVARVNSGYQSFSNEPHNLNRHYSFPGDPGMPGGPGPSCRFDRAQSYHDEGIQHGYVGSGRTYDTVRDMVTQASPRTYVNGQIDGFVPNQWQMSGSEVPFFSVRNMDNDGYSYHIPEYPNVTVGINGYPVFRPSNGL
ncbi:hypothetical protein DH2020_019843 [Rehmannia glutinosa]|uniref:MATH domain-containing protein n=1 Tax=Rehmannia glutinosa TaxID=99300 RepID=A0ABR0WFW4_REHGL